MAACQKVNLRFLHYTEYVLQRQLSKLILPTELLEHDLSFCLSYKASGELHLYSSIAVLESVKTFRNGVCTRRLFLTVVFCVLLCKLY